jgi:Trp operon repressor
MPFQNWHQWTDTEIQTVQKMLAENKPQREIDAAIGVADAKVQIDYLSKKIVGATVYRAQG